MPYQMGPSSFSLTHSVSLAPEPPSVTSASVFHSQLQTLTATTQHYRSSSIPTRLTFVLSENAISLSLCFSRTTIAHQSPAPLSSLYQLQTLTTTTQHHRSSSISMRPTFVSSKNAQNCLSVVSNHNAKSFLTAFDS